MLTYAAGQILRFGTSNFDIWTDRLDYYQRLCQPKRHNGLEPSPNAWRALMLPITPISHYEIVAFDLYSFSLFYNPYEGKNLLNFRGA